MAVILKIFQSSSTEGDAIETQLNNYLTANSLDITDIQIHGFGDGQEKGLILIYEE